MNSDIRASSGEGILPKEYIWVTTPYILAGSQHNLATYPSPAPQGHGPPCPTTNHWGSIMTISPDGVEESIPIWPTWREHGPGRPGPRWAPPGGRSGWRGTAPCWSTSGRPCSWWRGAAGGGPRSWSTASAGCSRPPGSSRSRVVQWV